MAHAYRIQAAPDLTTLPSMRVAIVDEAAGGVVCYVEDEHIESSLIRGLYDGDDLDDYMSDRWWGCEAEQPAPFPETTVGIVKEGTLVGFAGSMDVAQKFVKTLNKRKK